MREYLLNARRTRVLAWLLAGAVSTAGLFQAQRAINQVEENRVETSSELCQKIDTLTDAIRAILDEAARRSPDTTPEGLARRHSFNEFAREQLAPLPCKEIVKPNS